MAKALSELPQKGAGRNVDSPYYFLAYFVAAVLDSEQVDVTGYVDGVYHQILCIAFQEIFPASKDSTHRHYGKKAIEALRVAHATVPK